MTLLKPADLLACYLAIQDDLVSKYTQHLEVSISGVHHVADLSPNIALIKALPKVCGLVASLLDSCPRCLQCPVCTSPLVDPSSLPAIMLPNTTVTLDVAKVFQFPGHDVDHEPFFSSVQFPQDGSIVPGPRYS